MAFAPYPSPTSSSMAFTQSFNLVQSSINSFSPRHPPLFSSSSHDKYSPINVLTHQQQHNLSLSRRLFLPSVSGLWDAITGSGGNSPRDAAAAVRRGMALFRQGDVAGSLVEFDRAIQLDPRQKAYLWQRGLSLYYLDRFEEGAEQFRLDVAQNPNDTEESIWCFLCETQLHGLDEARKRFLEVGRDPRPVMREAYNMFKDGSDPEQLVAAFSNGRDADYFYASLYAGLYYEAQKDSGGAKRHLLAGSQSPYAQRAFRADDYMASLAKVHCACRNWSSN